MKVIIDTNSLLSLVRYYLPFDNENLLFNFIKDKIENGEINSLKTYSMLENWLKPMLHNKVDTIVLGCTHYPLVKKTILDIVGEDVLLIDTGDAIAKRVVALSQDLQNHNKNALNIEILYTGKINSDMVKIILGKNKFEMRKCEL